MFESCLRNQQRIISHQIKEVIRFLFHQASFSGPKYQSAMRKNILSILLVLFPIVAGAQRHYTVLVSLDGFRWDYPIWYDTPFLDEMAIKGAEANLIPSFPSKTFPNHYTLATGLYPDHHGIIANSFYDPSTKLLFSLGDSTTKFNPYFYGGEPIWLTAERHGLRTAVFYWPGSDVKIKGRYPWHYHNYEEKPRLTFEQRIVGIISMLSLPEEERPALVMAYFEQPDANGHSYGPQHKRTRDAVEKIDKQMRKLYDGIKALPDSDDINLIILSDHGMTPLAPDRIVNLTSVIQPEWIARAEGNDPLNLYIKEGFKETVYQSLQHIDHIRFWYKEDIPAYLHFGTNPRIGDIVVMPDLGWIVDTKLSEWGSHGFDPQFSDMHALFRAIGPDIEHCNMGDINNVSIYNLICLLLNIEPAPNDGNMREIANMLKPCVQERIR